MLGSWRASRVPGLLRTSWHGLDQAERRSLQRQWHHQLSSQRWRSGTAVRQRLQPARRFQSSMTEAAKSTTVKATEAAKTTTVKAAKATASGGSRILAYIYGTGVVLLLSFGYLYVTDTRASIHQYFGVPLMRLVHQDAEDAHHAGIRYIKGMYDFSLHPRERGSADKELGDLKIEVFGHVLDNPIGTSAGIDKNAEIPSALFALGPAIVEVGGVTPLPQDGNDKPRVFRIPSQNALINRYGLNSAGAEHVAMQLRERVRSFAYAHGLGLGAESERIVLDGKAKVPPGSLVHGKLLAVQLAKNKTTPDHGIAAVAEDYVFCVDHLAKYADILVVNVSSPNTPGLRDLQAVGPLTAILTAVVDAAKSTDRKTKPAVMVKVSPDEDSDSQIEGICSAIWSSGVDGVIVGNTTKRRPDPMPQGYIMPANETKLLQEMGGYSGPQMFERTLNLVKRYRSKLDEGAQGNKTSSSSRQQEQDPSTKDRQVSGSREPDHDSIDENLQRDINRLKPMNQEAEVASKQPLVQLPARHSSETLADKADRTANVGPTGESSTPSSLLEKGKEYATSARDAAEGALRKIITKDGTEAPFKEVRHSEAKPAPERSAQTSQPNSDSPAKFIFATGGITNGEQCLQILNAGASICQVYTAMMYGGVGTITRMKSEMRGEIKKQNGK